MQFYLKQGTDDSLFHVMNSVGLPVYRVSGGSLAIGNKIYLTDPEGKKAARIYSVGVSSVARYLISVEEKERARVTVNLHSAHHPVRIRGVNWRFRGNLVTRSYDILDESSAVVMSHGRCWNAVGDCYGADIADDADTLICLCIAVILDSTVIGGSASAVPVG